MLSRETRLLFGCSTFPFWTDHLIRNANPIVQGVDALMLGLGLYLILSAFLPKEK
jgi:hypothetical protein